MQSNSMPPIIKILAIVACYEALNIYSFFFGRDSILYFQMLFAISAWYIFFISAKNTFILGNSAFKFFILWSVFMVLRGSLLGNFPMNSDGSGTYITGLVPILKNCTTSISLMSFMLPLFVMLPFDVRELNYMRKISVIVACLIVLLFLVFRDVIFTQDIYYGMVKLHNGEESNVRYINGAVFFAMGLVTLMAYNASYISSKIRYLLIFIMFLFFVCSVAGGGRGGSLSTLVYLLIALYLYNRYSGKHKHSFFSFKNVSIMVVLAGVIAYLFLNTHTFDFLLSRTFGEESMSLENFEDNRGDMVDNFIRDFNDHPLDWIFGRGINGTYFSGSMGYRPWLEYGYLWLILKGGVVYLFLYCYILLHAARLGFKHSNNLLCKSYAFMLLCQVLSLIPFGVPTFNCLFIFGWHGVMMLNNPDIRSKSDAEIKQMFYLTK